MFDIYTSYLTIIAYVPISDSYATWKILFVKAWNIKLGGYDSTSKVKDTYIFYSKNPLPCFFVCVFLFRIIIGLAI